jgi:KUP system potassium uptake protein
VPGLAVYLTSSEEGVTPILLHNLKHKYVLHDRVYLVTVETAVTPTISVDRRIALVEIGEGLARVRIRYGFMQEPSVPDALYLLIEDAGENINPMTATYFLSRQIVLPSGRPGMALWREQLFAAMSRNSATPMTTVHLPVNRVIELGSQVEI